MVDLPVSKTSNFLVSTVSIHAVGMVLERKKLKYTQKGGILYDSKPN